MVKLGSKEKGKPVHESIPFARQFPALLDGIAYEFANSESSLQLAFSGASLDNGGMQPLEILETCLCVSDLKVAERFYADVLGLTVHSRQEGRHVFFRCGRGMLLLFNPDQSSLAGEIPPHGTRGAGHVAFAAAESELPVWRQHLETHGVPIERFHSWPGGGHSLYFRDPAGNSLELATPAIWGRNE